MNYNFIISLLLLIFTLVFFFVYVFVFRRNLKQPVRILALVVLISNMIMLAPILPPHESIDETAKEVTVKANPVEVFFYSLQLTSLDAQYGDLILRASDKGLAYKSLFIILCILSPLIFGGTILSFSSVITNKIKYFVFSLFSDVYYFSELNEASLKLAQSIIQNNPKALIVFCNYNGKEKSNTASIAMEKSFVLLNNSELKFARHPFFHKKFFFEISDKQDVNVDSSKKLLALFNTAKAKNKMLHKIFLFSDSESSFCTFDSNDLSKTPLILINRRRIVANNLLFSIPLYKAISNNEKCISVLVVGAGSTGNEIIKSCVWCGQLGDDYQLKVTVIDKNASLYKSQLLKECPEFFNGEYKLDFFDADVTTKDFENILNTNCRNVNYIVVVLGNDELNIQTSIFLRGHYLRSNLDKKNEPLIIPIVFNGLKHSQAKSLAEKDIKNTNTVTNIITQTYNIIPFGSTDSIYSYNQIVNSEIEKLAINVHAAYDKLFSETKSTEAKIIANYNLNETNRNSNRANAIHILYKLFLLGYGMKPYSQATSEERKKSLMLIQKLVLQLNTSSIIEKLSKLEHDRWNAFERSEGWQGVSCEDTEKYLPYTNGKHKNNCAKLHPCICTWEELDAVSAKFDPKLKIYDELLIKEIPAILGLDESPQINISNVKYVLVEKKEK